MKFNFSYDITLADGQYESPLQWFTQAFRPEAKARKFHLRNLR
jgi:hypothetical protein